MSNQCSTARATLATCACTSSVVGTRTFTQRTLFPVLHEHPVQQQHVEVDVEIQGRAEALDHQHRIRRLTGLTQRGGMPLVSAR